MKYTDMVQGYKYRIDGTNTMVICTKGKNIIPGEKETPPSEYRAYDITLNEMVCCQSPEEFVCNEFITTENLLEITIDYIKKNPNNVYGKVNQYIPGCFYTKGKCTDESVGCVFGQVLTMLGFKMAQFDDGENSPGIQEVCKQLGIFGAETTMNKLRKIQKRQDRLRSWGECIKDI